MDSVPTTPSRTLNVAPIQYPVATPPSSMAVGRLLLSSRKSLEWDRAQTATDPEDCAVLDSFVIKNRLMLPKTTEDWKLMDEVISSHFDSAIEQIDVSSLSDQLKHDSALSVLKDSIYGCIVDNYGSKQPLASDSKAKTRVDQQMKTLRRKKKLASKEFKKYRREGADEDVISAKRTEWRKLTRVHNKIRLQELELENKLTEIQNNTEFAKRPFEFIKNEVTKGPGNKSSPSCSKEEAVEFFTARYSDPQRTTKVDFPEFVDLPSKPSFPLPLAVPPKEDFEKYILGRRNKSTPGPDGIPFIVYKKCPTVRARLIQIIRCLWKVGSIPIYERFATKILIAKSQSRVLKEYRDITLFNASLKALTGTWARAVSQYMVRNGYFDTTVQKGFIQKTAGCIEHNQTIVDLLKESKKNKAPFQLAFLDLENAFGSAKHNLIFAALTWYNVPEDWIKLIKCLYDECFVVVTTPAWNTPPIQIQKGSLQGGPEAGTLFNVPWNIVLCGIFRFMTVVLSYKKIEKPVSGFADDLSVKTRSSDDMSSTLKFAEDLCEWSRCFKFKESKSYIMAMGSNGKPDDPKLRLNGKLIPPLTSKPFKFLGRWIYPSLKDKELIDSTVKKVENLMKKTDELLLDGRKKCWIYQHGILPYLCWDFSMVEVNTTAIAKMEATVNRHLKKWLKLTRSADTSILYRGSCGLNITGIKDAVIASRCNTEIILCTSRDPIVRTVAKRRRDSDVQANGQNTPKRIRTAVRDLEFQKAFCQNTRSANDRRGLGMIGANNKVHINKKSIVNRTKELSNEEKIGEILSLSVQSSWTNWDELIEVDLKWNEMMYGMSPSLLSFWLNAVQNTLPDPTNLRRWGKQFQASCTLCKWKNCTLLHILCSCRVALEQGRISYRHDSVLGCIVKWIKTSLMENKKRNYQPNDERDKPIRFVKKGAKIPRKKPRKVYSYWSNFNDWKVLHDSRTKQYQIPPCIASSSLRPDICLYSVEGKKVCFIELTSPAEENIQLWKIKKRQKYLDLVEEAKSNGFSACCRTIEVGARGFVSKSSLNVFSLLGFSSKQKNDARREISRVAIRCSHFIWINRDNPTWSSPNRIC